MDDLDAELTEGLDRLATVADGLTPEQAVDELDDATLQAFWREWPRASGWAGALWRLLNADLESAARPLGDPESAQIDTGGSG